MFTYSLSFARLFFRVCAVNAVLPIMLASVCLAFLCLPLKAAESNTSYKQEVITAQAVAKTPERGSSVQNKGAEPVVVVSLFKLPYIAAQDVTDTDQNSTNTTPIDTVSAVLTTKVEELEMALTQQKVINQRLVAIIFLIGLAIMGFWILKIKSLKKHFLKVKERDPLTGIMNRNTFFAMALDVLEHAENVEHTVSFILFDLAKFKRINDKYGHTVGDWVLKQVAKKVQTIGRQGDMFARIDGEEFAFLLVDCNAEQASVITERCQQAINEIDPSVVNYHFSVSAYFGVTDTQLSGYELEAMFSHADEALQEAKTKGHNEIVTFEDKFVV
ncbi:GGDEF domain-containing protein [Flocculibacter collagenilyticus]|uniref:GGDEF domain-containing protein n=1 Tax=Flocculibacter collagenilyticus TaxID=2744479 RepID=UPI0018F3FD16|nr:GGDEF domain-containing protein [Flocculibacter collagenilyticus]